MSELVVDAKGLGASALALGLGGLNLTIIGYFLTNFLTVIPAVSTQ